MFSSHQEPSQSKERISFPLKTETETFDRSFYHPSLTANQLSTEEIDDTLNQIDQIYRKKEDRIFRGVFFSAFGFVAVQGLSYDWGRYIPYYLRNPLYRGLNTLIFTAGGLHIWNLNRKAKQETVEFLEQANQRTVPKGFRWYFPQSFSKIELYPDYTHDPNQLSIDDNDGSQEI